MFSHASQGESRQRSADTAQRAPTGVLQRHGRDETLQRRADDSARVTSLKQLSSTLNRSSAPVQAKARFTVGGAYEALLYTTWNRFEAFMVKQKLPLIGFDDYKSGRLSMLSSDLDYGEINVDDDNHLFQLYFNLKKQIARTDPSVRGEKEPIAKQELEQRTRERSGDRQRDERNLIAYFKTVFIGEGASVAYAISAMGSTFSPVNAAVIGPGDQPWKAQRGPGVVAHPSHQITPKRQYGSQTRIDDTWQDRGAFSRDVESVVRRLQHIEGTVKTIRRGDGGVYQIVLNEGYSVYADKVIVGPGAGAHRVPDGTNPDHVATDSAKVSSTRRIMSMDVFTQVADRLPEGATIVLSGANGGIDVAYDALRRQFKVQFVVSSGANFLTGFPNYAAYAPYIRGALASLKHAHDTLATSKKLTQETARKIEDQAQKIIAAAKKAGFDPDNLDDISKLYLDQERSVAKDFQKAFKGNFKGVYFGRAGTPTASDRGVQVTVADPYLGDHVVVGDFFVYAIGQEPDTKKNPAFKILEELKAQLVPLLDIDKRFTDEGESVLGLSTADRSLTVVGATAYRYAPNIGLHAGLGPNPYPALDSMKLLKARLTTERQEIRLMSEPFWKLAHTVDLNYSVFVTHVENKEVDRMASRKVLFEKSLTDFSAFVKTNRANAHVIPQDKLAPIDQYLKTAGRAALTLGDKANATMSSPTATGPVTASLPTNVLINDQLTPSRSQIEATHGFLPLDIGTFANFTTDDRTALAVHISAKYPSLADYKKGRYLEALVEMIIANRKNTAVPNLLVTDEKGAATLDTVRGAAALPVPPDGATFQSHWLAQLSRASMAVKNHLVG